MLKSTEHQIVAFMLVTAAALGVAHALITPAWMNAEEPGHFEYVRLIAERGELPEQGRSYPALERQMVDSIIVANSMWGALGRMSNTRIGNELGVNGDEDWSRIRDELSHRSGGEMPGPTSLGITQFGEPPGYYLLVTPLLLLVPNGTLETQLIVARLGSVLIGVLSIWLAYLTAGELFPERRLVRVGTPALVALTPGFVNIMSSVQNTVAAAAALTFVLFAATRLVRRGLSMRRLLLLAAAMVVCALSKPTAWVGIPLAVLAVPLARRRRWSVWVAAGIGAALVAAGVAVTGWQWPASWHNYSPGIAVRAQTPHGQRVFALDVGRSYQIWQRLPASTIEQLQGQTATLGAWMRARDGSVRTQLPSLWASAGNDELKRLPSSGREAVVGEAWEFHTSTVVVPADTACAAVRLVSEGVEAPGTTVEYDGIVLAVGEWPLEEAPVFRGRSATRGAWDGQSFKNLVDNGSAERGQLLMRPQVASLLDVEVADSSPDFNKRLESFQDWRSTLPLLSQTIRWLFASFWARFGWNTPGLPRGIIWLLGALSGLAGAGLLTFGFRSVRASPPMPLWQRRALALCLGAVLLVGSLAVLRLDPIKADVCSRYQGRFISTGYYVLPSVTPVLMLWLLGLMVWVPERWHRWFVVGCILGFFLLVMGGLLGRQIPFYLAAYGLESTPTLWSIPQAWLP